MKTNLMDKINSLVQLGNVLKTDEGFLQAKEIAKHKNPFFMKEFVNESVKAITEQMLQEDKLNEWLAAYPALKNFRTNKTVGIIMAGNLPLVGFHDFLCAYICGYKIRVKLSSKDDVLFIALLKALKQIDKTIGDDIQIVEKLENFDAVIATGSNNSHKYFEYYFRNHPKILRKNRSSIAILNGQETTEELQALADDIFMYFGLGCRNVSKLFVPQDYDITHLFPHFEKYKWLHDHSKFMNNYDYHRAILLLNQTPHLADNKVMIQESEHFTSPLSMLYYERFADWETLNTRIASLEEETQCLVGNLETKQKSGIQNILPFGTTQAPALNDYADGVNTVAFLLGL